MGELTIAEARRAAADWCDAWNRRDLDRVMEHYAEDVRLHSPTVVQRWGIANGWLEGKAKVREHFAIGIRTPSLRFDLVDVLLGVGIMAILYRRESGLLVIDAVEPDGEGKARVVRVYYAAAVSSAA